MKAVDAAVQRLLDRLATDTPRWIVGMAGLPGAGKSTIAAQIAQEVNARTALGTLVALGMDGFHLTKAQLRALPNPDKAFARRGAPWTFDPAALHARLQLLRAAAGRDTVSWPGFQHDIGDPVESAEWVPPTTRLVLVEGIYLLHRADGWEPVSRFFEERWYLDTPLDVAMERLTQRHMRVWGMSQVEAEARIASNDRLNGEIVRDSAQYADWRLTD